MQITKVGTNKQLSDNRRTMRPTRFNWPLISAVTSVLMILIWGAARSPWLAYDDAFITYRYADNLRQGFGFVYNPGERVLGITTPLWGLLLTTFGFLIPDSVLLGHWLSVLSWMALALGAQQLLTSYQLPQAANCVPLLIALSPAFLFACGMETNFLLALMVWVAWAWRTEHFRLTVFLAACALLTRQDSALWLLFLGLAAWRKIGIFPWREGIGATLLTLPWFGVAWWYYGSPLPNSAAAKIGQTDLMPLATAQSFIVSFWQTMLRDVPLAVVLLILGLAILGILTIVRQVPALWWLPVWLLVYLGVYTGYGVVAFPWYFLPALLACLLLAAIGFGRILRVLQTKPTRALLLASSLAVFVSLFLAMWSIRQLRHTNADYPAVGRWLAANSSAESLAAMIEIGLIGYTSNRPIVDTMGLVSRNMTTHQVGWVETLAFALADYQPEYAIVLPNTAWDSIVATWWFHNSYQEATTIGDISIYQRQAPTMPYWVEEPVQLADQITVEGISAETDTLSAGQPFTLTVNVAVADSPHYNYQLTTYLSNFTTLERYAITTSEPFDGAYRSTRWQAGDRLSLPVRLQVPADLPEGSYTIDLIFYNTDLDRSLGLAQSPEQAYPSLRFGSVASVPITQDTLDEAKLTESDFVWNDGIALSAYAFRQENDQLVADLRWFSQTKRNTNYKLFLHLIDEAGQIVTQVDAYPLDGRYPPAAWPAGKTIDDSHSIPLPPDLAAGSYTLRLGFYNQDGQLMLRDSAESFVLFPAVLQR